MQFTLSFTYPLGCLRLKMTQCKSLLLKFMTSNTNYLIKPQELHLIQSRKPQNVPHHRQILAFVLKTKNFPHPNSHFSPKLISSSENVSYFVYILKHLENPDLSIDLCNPVLHNLSSNSCNNRNSLQALSLFREMLVNGFFPDNYTISFVLKACARSKAFRDGVQT